MSTPGADRGSTSSVPSVLEELWDEHTLWPDLESPHTRTASLLIGEENLLLGKTGAQTLSFARTIDPGLFLRSSKLALDATTPGMGTMDSSIPFLAEFELILRHLGLRLTKHCAEALVRSRKSNPNDFLVSEPLRSPSEMHQCDQIINYLRTMIVRFEKLRMVIGVTHKEQYAQVTRNLCLLVPEAKGTTPAESSLAQRPDPAVAHDSAFRLATTLLGTKKQKLDSQSVTVLGTNETTINPHALVAQSAEISMAVLRAAQMANNANEHAQTSSSLISTISGVPALEEKKSIVSATPTTPAVVEVSLANMAVPTVSRSEAPSTSTIESAQLWQLPLLQSVASAHSATRQTKRHAEETHPTSQKPLKKQRRRR